MDRTFTKTLYFPTTYTVTVDGGRDHTSHLNRVERAMSLLNITEIKHPWWEYFLEQEDSNLWLPPVKIETHILKGIQPIAYRYHFISAVV